MLAKANRLVSADDFRSITKEGKRCSTGSLVLYAKRDSGSSRSRFGFIVAKSVGAASTRNLVKRRMRAIAREVLPQLPSGSSVVVRALPQAASADWNRLHTDFVFAVSKVLRTEKSA